MDFKVSKKVFGYKVPVLGYKVLFLGIVGVFMAILTVLWYPKDTFAVETQADLFDSVEWCQDSNGYNRIKVKFKVDLWSCNSIITWEPPPIWFGGRYCSGGTCNFNGAFYGSNVNGTATYRMLLQWLPENVTADLKDPLGNICVFHPAGSVYNYYLMDRGVSDYNNAEIDTVDYSSSDYIYFTYNNSRGYEGSPTYQMTSSDQIFFDYNVTNCGVDQLPVVNPNAWITSHTSGFETDDPFVLTYSYENADDYLTFILVLKGYNNGDLIYSKDFSKTITDPDDSGSVIIYGLPVGNYTVDFKFVNYPAGTSYDQDYDFNFIVTSYIPSYSGDIDPIDPTDEFIPADNDAFYTYISPYATSTVVYNTITSVFEPVGNWIGQVSHNLAIQFDRDIAKDQASNISKGIKITRYYSASVDQIFGGFPLSFGFVSVLFILMIVGVFKLVMYIKQLIR